MFCCGACAIAQEAPPTSATAPAPVVAPAPDPLADDLKAYGVLLESGFNDELIYKINRKIAEMGGTPDPRLLYYRGLAYYRFGWFPEAKADLEIAQRAKIVELPGGFATALALNGLKRFALFMPPKMEEIHRGERVLFRMHYFHMEGGTATVQGLLPTAHRINSEMFGSDLEATTVLVFDTYEQFLAFNKVLTGNDKPGSWVWAKSWCNFVLISLQFPDGSSASLDHRDPFVSTIVHEINHAMLYRLMGSWSDQPDGLRKDWHRLRERRSARSSFLIRRET